MVSFKNDESLLNKFLLFTNMYLLEDDIDDELFINFFNFEKPIELNVLTLIDACNWQKCVSDKTQDERITWANNLILQINNIFINKNLNSLSEEDTQLFSYYLYTKVNNLHIRFEEVEEFLLSQYINGLKTIVSNTYESMSAKYCQHQLRYELIFNIFHSSENVYFANIHFLKDQLDIYKETQYELNTWYEENVRTPPTFI